MNTATTPRRVRITDDLPLFNLKAGDVTDLVEYIEIPGIPAFGVGEDGADGMGDYWAKPGEGTQFEQVCIGKPGMFFEFIEEAAAVNQTDEE